MAKREINRSITEMQGDRIYSGVQWEENITGTSLVDLGAISFKSMGTFTIAIIPVLSSGVAPTSLTVTFNKFIDNVAVAGTSFSKVIEQADIVSSPDAQIVNVEDLTPISVFTDLQITVQSSDVTDIDLSIHVVGD